MTIELLEHRAKVTDAGMMTSDDFRVGRYFVRRTGRPMEDGTIWTNITVNKDNEARFLPDVYYEDDWFSDDPKPCFKIQTTAYGALEAEDIEKVIAGYNEALEAVKMLTARFIK